MAKQENNKAVEFEFVAPLFGGGYEGYLSSVIDDELSSIENGLDTLEEALELSEEAKLLLEYTREQVLENSYTCNSELSEELAKENGYIIEAILSSALGCEVELTYNEIISPQYYNYTNDKVVYKAKVAGGLDSIQAYIDSNIKNFTKWVKDNFTSCDGFYSFYSNDIEDWDNVHNYEDTDEVLSFYHRFILENELSGDIEYEFEPFYQNVNELVVNIGLSKTDEKGKQLGKMIALSVIAKSPNTDILTDSTLQGLEMAGIYDSYKDTILEYQRVQGVPLF